MEDERTPLRVGVREADQANPRDFASTQARELGRGRLDELDVGEQRFGLWIQSCSLDEGPTAFPE